jgi:hypothetical protein
MDIHPTSTTPDPRRSSRVLPLTGNGLVRRLLHTAPELRGHVIRTPSGSVHITRGHGEGIEIGRLPDRGGSGWVVVHTSRGRTTIHHVQDPDQAIELVIAGLRHSWAA